LNSYTYKFLSLPGTEKLLLLRAFVTMAVIRAALVAMPFASLRAWVERRKPASRRLLAGSRPAPERVGWAVATAGNFFPGGTRCLPRALVAEWMLLSNGYRPSFKIGVARAPDGAFEAHAWIECGGRFVIGGFEPGRYSELLVRESIEPQALATFDSGGESR
jgi:hypothetical protein